jgi:hypothetical protein
MPNHIARKHPLRMVGHNAPRVAPELSVLKVIANCFDLVDICASQPVRISVSICATMRA